jgi:hypothetical protein
MVFPLFAGGNMVVGWLGTPNSDVASGVNLLTGPAFLALKIVLTVVSGLATIGLVVVLIVAFDAQPARLRQSRGCLKLPWSTDLHVLRDALLLTASLTVVTLGQLPIALAGGTNAAVVLVLFTCLFGTAAVATALYYGILVLALAVHRAQDCGRCRPGYLVLALFLLFGGLAVGISLTLALLLPLFDMASPLYGSDSSLLAGSLFIALVARPWPVRSPLTHSPPQVMAKLLVQARETSHMVNVAMARAEIAVGLATLEEKLEPLTAPTGGGGGAANDM